MKAGETMTTPIEGVVVMLNKIVRDQRGFLAELMPGGLANPTAHGEFGNLYLSVAETKFVARGGHYHKTENSIESFYCIGGTVVWILYDYRKESPTQGTLVDIVVGKPLDASACATAQPTMAITVEQGVMAQITVVPGVYHSFVPLSDEPAQVIGLHTKPYNEADYQRIALGDVPGISDVAKRYGFHV